MRCPTCNHDNPADAAFCGGCGTNLTAPVTCSACGRANMPGVRFCHGCGVPLIPAAPERPNSDAIEQRFTGLENDLADLAMEVAGLVALKEQLQEALDGMRKRAAGDATAVAKSSTPAQPVAPSVVPSRPGVIAPTSIPAGTPAVLNSASHTPQPTRINSERVAVVHFEDQPAYQEELRALIEKFGYARYCPAPGSLESVGTGRRLVALNLLLDSADPMSVVTDSARGIETPCAFTYCGDGTRGFTLGMVDFFPPPFEPNLCVTTLLERPSPAQRLLVVSDAVDATSELRSILTRLGCATSVAFDGKQALNLLPMVRPDVILVDLNLPKGDALRVISRVRADPANVTITFALMWQTPIVAADFRQQVAKAAKDLPFSADDLRRAMGRELGPGGAAYVNTASKAA